MGEESKSEKKQGPSITLSFGQIVSLGLFILAVMSSGVKLLYDAIDKRMDKIEDKIDRHDSRINELTGEVSVQKVKLNLLLQEKDRAKPDEKRVAMVVGGEESDPPPDEAPRSSPALPPATAGCRSDTDCPEGHACHDSECWSPVSGSGGGSAKAKVASSAALASADPAPIPVAMAHAQEESETDRMTRRKARLAKRCADQWRVGCPPPEVRLADSLRTASGQLATMQLREASGHLARAQRSERGLIRSRS